MYYDEPELRFDVAVRLDHYILTFEGIACAFDNKHQSPLLESRGIWKYNLYTEKWGMYLVPLRKIAPAVLADTTAVVIDNAVYMFGGWDTHEMSCLPINDLWKLTKTPQECFEWTRITTDYHAALKTPSPCSRHTAWEYDKKLWVFGGAGSLDQENFTEHGNFAQFVSILDLRINNQLLCFHPSSNHWTNPKCFGTVPTPRSGHATTMVNGKVWLYGGRGVGFNTIFDDFYELNMDSLTWTQIQIGEIKLPGFTSCTLNAITSSQLILHGGISAGAGLSSDTWVLDLPSHSWRVYTSDKDHPRSSHSACIGLNNNVIIIGGKNSNVTNCLESCDSIFHVRFEPKSLQQLAIQILYQSGIPLMGLLPKKLTDLFDLPKEEENLGNVSDAVQF